MRVKVLVQHFGSLFAEVAPFPPTRVHNFHLHQFSIHTNILAHALHINTCSTVKGHFRNNPGLPSCPLILRGNWCKIFVRPEALPDADHGNRSPDLILSLTTDVTPKKRDVAYLTLALLAQVIISTSANKYTSVPRSTLIVAWLMSRKTRFSYNLRCTKRKLY